jgi:hypothetical protein
VFKQHCRVCHKQYLRTLKRLASRAANSMYPYVPCATAFFCCVLAATWLMVYCNVACVSIRRDHSEATYHKKHSPQDGARDGGISKWMWTAGIGSPHSQSDTMSSFPAIENPTDAKRTQQGLAPEYTSSTLSPSPRKQAKWGAAAAAGQEDQMERGGPGRQVGRVAAVGCCEACIGYSGFFISLATEKSRQ